MLNILQHTIQFVNDQVEVVVDDEVVDDEESRLKKIHMDQQKKHEMKSLKIQTVLKLVQLKTIHQIMSQIME
jgi:hypothetical protein